MKTFEELGLDELSLYALKKKGFEEPTPIQEKVIPVLIENEYDIIGQAQTGTGKTAAFALPIIEKLNKKTDNTQVLVLTPTRELAIQIASEFQSLKGKRKFSVLPVYGGQSIESQIRRLKKGIDIVVGTPGRIIDHIHRKTIDFRSIDFLVIDEADEMLNMGFIDDVEKILAVTNKEKRVLLFSATMPSKIRQLSKRYMKETKYLSVQGTQITVDLTEQIYFEVADRDKFEALCRIIDMQKEFYGLIFCRTKVDADLISNKLLDRGYEADCLHGDISQFQRERILKKFKDKRTHILVATDVAARGLDIEDLTHVINYSLPQDPEKYIHRIGRTGRAGKKGVAITFVTPAEYRNLLFIQKISRANISKEKVPEVKDILEFKKNKIAEDIKELAETSFDKIYQEISDNIMESNNIKGIVCALLKKAYEKELDFSVYNRMSKIKRKSEAKEIQDTVRLFVALGKQDGYSPKKLIEFLKKNVDISYKSIKDVFVLDKFSFLTVDYKAGENLIYFFKKISKGRRPIITRAKERKRN